MIFSTLRKLVWISGSCKSREEIQIEHTVKLLLCCAVSSKVFVAVYRNKQLLVH